VPAAKKKHTGFIGAADDSTKELLTTLRSGVLIKLQGKGFLPMPGTCVEIGHTIGGF